jgi:ATP-binding cassette subfamily F protein 3
MSLLSASDLSKSYGPNDIFNQVSLSISRGARIGMVGENGVGKTTLLRVLLGEEDPSEGQVRKAKNLRVGYLPQEAVLDSENTLWQDCLGAVSGLIEMENKLRKLEQEMVESPSDQVLIDRYGRIQHHFDELGGFTYQNTIERTLAGLGFQRSDFQKPLNHLSGGQRTRALLARILLSNPDLVLLDEPTNHLDVQAMEWLEGFLHSWSGTALLVSHDRYFLDQTVNIIWEMTPAITVYHGNYSAYLLQREARYEHQIKEHEAQQAFITKEEEYIRRNIAGQNTRQAQGRRTRLERLLRDAKLAPPGKSRRIRLELKAGERSGDLVVRTNDLAVGYQDDENILIHVPDLVLWRRECAAIMGPNGAGKTTFLKTLLNQLPPLGGRVEIGASVKVGYFSQVHESLSASWTLVHSVQQYAKNMLEAEARSYLAKFLFTEDDVFKEVQVLSGGERGRLALACLALQGANLLLLDEPTNHLDLPSQEILQRLLANFNGTILLVSHDRYLVDAVATQVWEVLPEEKSLHTFKGSYTELKAMQAQIQTQDRNEKSHRPKHLRSDNHTTKKGHISQKKLRDLEAKINQIEEKMQEISSKLEHPLEVNESIAELGDRYVELKKALEEKWAEWESLFRN